MDSAHGSLDRGYPPSLVGRWQLDLHAVGSRRFHMYMGHSARPTDETPCRSAGSRLSLSWRTAVSTQCEPDLARTFRNRKQDHFWPRRNHRKHLDDRTGRERELSP